MNCPKTTKIDSVALHSLYFQSSGKKIFCTKSLQAMKSGFFMITQNVKNHGLTLGQLSTSTPKPNIHAKKVLLCIWWDWKDVLYYESLQPGETITADQQSTNLSDALEEKKPFTDQECRKVILLHNNARPHVTKATQDHILALGWELPPHAAYSPDMAPSDYYLIRSLQHHLADTHFVRFEEIRKCIDHRLGSSVLFGSLSR